MTRSALHERIDRRDHLVVVAEQATQSLRDHARQALQAGDLAGLRSLIERHETQLSTLTENLRIYQAELRAQADELADSQNQAQSTAARFGALFAGLPVAVLLVSPDGCLVDHNRAAEQLFNLTAAHSSPRFLHRLMMAADFQQRVWPGLSDGRTSRLDGVAFIAEGGRRFFGELHVARLPASGDGREHLACAVIDRTDELASLQALRRAHEALRTSDAFLSDTAHLARIGGWELRTRPRQWLATEPLHRVFDVPPGETLTFEMMLSLCDTADRRRLEAAIEAALDDGRRFELEIGFHTRSGRPMRALALGHGDRSDDGAPRAVGVLQDISEQVHAAAAREAAETASRAKSDFLSRVSHELRTPLNAVIGFAQIMRMDVAHGDLTVKPRRVEMIEAAGRHLLTLIDELLELSRIESGRVTVETESVLLAPLLLDCLQMVAPQADADGVVLGALPPLAGCSVAADPKRLKQVLLNLLSNAIKYHRPQGGRVDIQVLEDGDRTHIDVVDDGVGIAAERLPELFQPFNRLGAERTTVQGTGMGLYLSRALTELMQGLLSVDSVQGRGTRARISLPVRLPAGPPATGTPPAPSPGNA